MEQIYQEVMTVSPNQTDCFGRLRGDALLWMIQQVSGNHSNQLGLTWEFLNQRNLFWAIVRHRVQITRMPMENEKITLETWPSPPTRVGYPRSVVAVDEKGQEVFRSMTLWVLMDTRKRTMVLPGSSALEVPGVLRGTELKVPGSLHPATLPFHTARTVCYGDLDVNRHMNNTRYMAWAEDLLPSAFHGEHPLQELVVNYANEAREGQDLNLDYELSPDGIFQVDIHRAGEDGKNQRICTLQARYSAVENG